MVLCQVWTPRTKTHSRGERSLTWEMGGAGDCARGQKKEPSFLVSLLTWKAAQAAEWVCRAASFPHMATCKMGCCSLDSSDSWQEEVYEKMDIVG